MTLLHILDTWENPLYSMEERCDQVIHCRDNSDEKNCYLLVFKEEESYSKKVPPFSIDTNDNSIIPVKVNVSTMLKNVLEISEFSHTIDLKLGITLEWYENRVLYHNLKSKDALNMFSDNEVWFQVLFTYHITMSQMFRLRVFGYPTSFLKTLTQMKLLHWKPLLWCQLKKREILQGVVLR